MGGKGGRGAWGAPVELLQILKPELPFALRASRISCHAGASSLPANLPWLERSCLTAMTALPSYNFEVVLNSLS